MNMNNDRITDIVTWVKCQHRDGFIVVICLDSKIWLSIRLLNSAFPHNNEAVISPDRSISTYTTHNEL